MATTVEVADETTETAETTGIETATAEGRGNATETDHDPPSAEEDRVRMTEAHADETIPETARAHLVKALQSRRAEIAAKMDLKDELLFGRMASQKTRR